MKMKPRHLFVASLVLFAASLPAHAASFYWDGNTGTGNAQDGSGTWDTTNTNWISGGPTGSNVAWTNNNVATFGVSADGTYAVTVATNPSATLAFNYSGYTLSATSAQTITFGGSTTGITVAAGKSATIGNNVTVTSPNNETNYTIGVTGSDGGTLIIENGGKVNNGGSKSSVTLSINRTTVEVKTGGSLTTRSDQSNAIFVNGLLKVTGGTVTSYGTLGIGQVSTAGNAGTLTISSGSVTASSANGLRFGTNSTALGGTVNLDGGSLSVSKFITGTTAPTTAILNLNSGTLKPTAGNSDWIASGITTNVLTGGAIIDSNGFDVTINRALLNGGGTDGGLTKNGSGLLTLSGANTYNGGTIINGGSLQFQSGAVPASGTITINSGGVLNLAGAFPTAADALAAGKLSTASAGVLALTGDSAENISFASYGSLMLGATSNATYTGTLTPSGSTYRLGGGGATLTLANTNALTGTNSLVVGAAGRTGTVVLASSNNLSGSITVQSGTLDVRGALDNTSGIVNNAALVFNPAADVTITPAAISGTGSLSKTGAGTLVLDEANSYGGTTSFTGGILRAAHSSAFASSSVTANSTLDDRQLQLDGGVTIANQVRVNGAGILRDGVLKNVGGSNTLSNFGFAGTSGTRIHIVSGSTLSLPNAFATGNASSLRIIGAGSVVLGGSNSGALGSSNTVSFGDGTNPGPTVRAGNDLAFGNAAIDFQANSASTLQSDSSAARSFANKVVFNGANATLGAPSTGDLSFDGTVTLAADLDISIQNGKTSFNGAVSGGSFGLTKSGPGTLTLGGSNTYNGPTSVSNGALVVNGNITTSAVTVNPGATIGGSGTLGGSLSIGSGGFLAPGNSAGNLTLGSGLDLEGTYVWELAALSTANPGIDFDMVTVTNGSVDLTGASLGLNLGAFSPSAVAFWQSNQTWTGIINNTGVGSLTGSFAAIDNSAWASLGSFSTTYSGNDVNLVWTAVPEPRSAATVGILGMMLLLGRRRCRTRS